MINTKVNHFNGNPKSLRSQPREDRKSPSSQHVESGDSTQAF